MNAHVSKTGTDSEKNGAKPGGPIAVESVNPETQQSTADGESRQADPVSQEPGRSMSQNGKRLLASAKQALIPIGKWVQDQSNAHPYLTIATSMGAAVLAGAVVRRTAAMRAGLTVGILTAVYLGRKRRLASLAGVKANG